MTDSDKTIQPNATDDELRTIAEEINILAEEFDCSAQDDLNDNNLLRSHIMEYEDTIKDLSHHIVRKDNIIEKLTSDIQCDDCFAAKLERGGK